MDDRDWRRLADYVISRRAVLEYATQEELAIAADTSLKTIGRIERGEAVRSSTLGKIEAALDWRPGSARKILAGGEPMPVPVPESEPEVDPDLEIVIEAYEAWISKLPDDVRDKKLKEFIRYVLSARKRARSGSSDRRDDDRPKTNTIG